MGCASLPKNDILSKSDPVAQLYTRDAQGGWQLVSKTEWIKDNQDPVFATPLKVDSYADTEREVRIAGTDLCLLPMLL